MPNLFTRTSCAKTLCAIGALSLLTLSGCNSIDPLKRTYMWHPDNAVFHNMAVMAANPDDLVRGRETSTHLVGMESDGVDRAWNGKALPLLGPASGGGGGGGGSGSSSGGGSGGGSGAPAGGGS